MFAADVVLCLWYVETVEPVKAAGTVSLQRLESSTTQLRQRCEKSKSREAHMDKTDEKA